MEPRSPLPRPSRPARLGGARLQDGAAQLVPLESGVEVEPILSTGRRCRRHATQRGRVVTPGELLQQLWGRRQTRRNRIVDVFVCKLREKIDDVAPAHSFIQTRYGVGYRLEAIPKSAAPALHATP